MTLREMVASAIPEGAFLRRDRGGDALYITNAPVKGGLGPIEGFYVESDCKIARIHIDPAFLESFAQSLNLPDDGLSLELARFTGSSPETARLFSDIIKAMENPPGADVYSLEKRLRQAAALAMRQGGGEGLYFCAKALAALKNTIKNETEEQK